MRVFAIQAIVAATVGCGCVFAQKSLVVPPEFAVNESPAFGMLAGFEERRRQQVLLHESMLRPLRGKTIRALVFRRDHLLGLELTATTARLEVVMSTARASVSAPSPMFADNHGADRRVVLRGAVALPRSPSVQPPIPWTPTNTVRLSLVPGFAYRGGHLCIQFDGTPHSPPPDPIWWPEYAQDSLGGKIIDIGVACGIAALRRPVHSGGWGRYAIPGGTQPILSRGRRHTPGTMMLGSRRLPTPLPLDPIGATGCHLYIDASTGISASFSLPGDRAGVGVAVINLQVPPGPAFLGARIYGQWVNIELGARSNPAGITTSNAFEIRVATAMPPGRFANILSGRLGPNEPFPPSGRIEIGRAPVIKFEYD